MTSPDPPIATADARFYAEIPSFDRFEEVADARHYHPVPDGWRLVITDVRGSTKAIEEGRYKDVNALGAASIVAVTNALPGVLVPYVFGGDGATMLVPGASKDAVDTALRGVRAMARDAFAMEMRVSAIEVGELRRDGFEVSVARFQASKDVALAMFRGSGLTEAEQRVKDPLEGERYAIGEAAAPAADFRGFECRWRPIPSRHGVALSLLVQASADDSLAATEVYRRTIEAIHAIAAEGGAGCPVSPSTLHLQGLGDPFDQEARIRSGRARGVGYRLRRLVAQVSATIGSALMRLGWNALGFPGEVYREAVVANTDYRKFDDLLRMVLDVSEAQVARIRELLDREHRLGHLVYGMHTSPAVVMTCVIGDYGKNHVHFVDGADGGYALAAKQLKTQMRDGGGTSRRTRRHTVARSAGAEPPPA